jgi:hypothetical protein
VTIRPSDDDLTYLAAIGAALRSQGQTFATKTDSIRHALKVAAAGVAMPNEVAQ